jgi:hypothetical protein
LRFWFIGRLAGKNGPPRNQRENRCSKAPHHFRSPTKYETNEAGKTARPIRSTSPFGNIDPPARVIRRPLAGPRPYAIAGLFI